MATYTPTKTLGDLLLVEVAPGWTKDKVLFLAGANYPLGTVLASVSGKFQALDPAGSAAAKKAVAVAAESVDATAADASGVVIARGAVLDPTELVWLVATTDAQKLTALSDLNALGIVARAAL
jgi:hypothetical protein